RHREGTDLARHGKAGRGSARQGGAWLGAAGQGKARVLIMKGEKSERGKNQQESRLGYPENTADGPNGHNVRQVPWGQSNAAGAVAKIVPGTRRLANYWSALDQHHELSFGAQHEFCAEAPARQEKI